MLKLHLSDKRQTANTEGIQVSRCISATVKQSFRWIFFYFFFPSLAHSLCAAQPWLGLEANLFQTSTAGNICPAYR